jgi:serine phosphatase RsbU (regulator of sigma subunit)
LFDYYQPASHVGGDFYDYIPMPDGRMGIVVADVVGHGVAAAMLTAKLAAHIRYKLLSSQRPADAVNALNASLSCELVEDHFVTLVLAVVAPETGHVTLVNAGHVPPLRATRDGRVVDTGMRESGWPLGIEPGAEYQQHELQLDPGDVVALYTDGVNESLNAAGEMYGIERLRRQLRAGPPDLQQLGQSIVDDIRDYVRISPPGDDMCLILIARE